MFYNPFPIAFCEREEERVSRGTYEWRTISAEMNSNISCQYGGVMEDIFEPVARRECDPRGEWIETNFTECATFADSTLRNISKVHTRSYKAV